MTPLFGKNEAKAARQMAGQAELERLTALPVVDLALEIMPAFGPDGPRGRGPDAGINIVQLLGWVNNAHFPRGTGYGAKLRQTVGEGLQLLEHADLVSTTRRQGGTWTAATRLGRTALAEGTVQDYLAGPPKP